MVEVIIEILLEFTLIFPGAFFRWAIFGFKGKYSDYLEAPPGVNIIVATIFFLLIGLTIKFIL